MKKERIVLVNPSYSPTLNMGIVYRNSIKRMLKSPLPYIVLAISLIAAIFVYFLWPYTNGIGDISIYYENDTWVILTMQVTFAMFALIGASFGETNAISSEKIYILSKPIKRSTFLWGKCLSSFTLAILFALPTIAIFGGIAIYEILAHGENIFDMQKGENPYAIFGSFIAILLFSSFVSTIWKYHTRGGVWMMFCFGVLLVYVILYPMLGAVWDGDFSDTARFWWLISPVFICFAFTTIGCILGAYIFIKSEIES